MSLRVLFFAYYFPPSAGPGVRRSIRFVKRLTRLGIEPTVVTVTGSTFRNPEEFGLDPAQCLLLDDREENLEGALAVGIDGRLVADPRGLTRAGLEEWGLLGERA